jgi:hypothetical protein
MKAAKTAIRWTFFGGLSAGMFIADIVHSINAHTMDSTKWLGLIMVAAFLVAAHFRLDAPAQRLVKAVLKEHGLA